MKEYRQKETFRIMSILGLKKDWKKKRPLSTHAQNLKSGLSFLDSVQEDFGQTFEELEINSMPNGSINISIRETDLFLKLNFSSNESFEAEGLVHGKEVLLMAGHFEDKAKQKIILETLKKKAPTS